MRFSIDERPSLSVAWSEQDRKTVQRALTRLHPGLYLHRSELQGGPWTVRDRDGGDLVVLEWKDITGRPLPLSMGLVDAVARQEKRTKADEIRPREMAAREADRKRRAHEKAVDEMEQIHRAHRSILGRRSVAFGRTLRP